MDFCFGANQNPSSEVQPIDHHRRLTDITMKMPNFFSSANRRSVYDPQKNKISTRTQQENKKPNDTSRRTPQKHRLSAPKTEKCSRVDNTRTSCFEVNKPKKIPNCSASKNNGSGVQSFNRDNLARKSNRFCSTCKEKKPLSVDSNDKDINVIRTSLKRQSLAPPSKIPTKRRCITEISLAKPVKKPIDEKKRDFVNKSAAVFVFGNDFIDEDYNSVCCPKPEGFPEYDVDAALDNIRFSTQYLSLNREYYAL